MATIGNITVRPLESGRFEITALGGTKIELNASDLKAFQLSLASITQSTNNPIKGSNRFSDNAKQVHLATAAKIGETLKVLSEKYGLAFAADLAGSFFKSSIENLIPKEVA